MRHPLAVGGAIPRLPGVPEHPACSRSLCRVLPPPCPPSGSLLGLPPFGLSRTRPPSLCDLRTGAPLVTPEPGLHALPQQGVPHPPRTDAHLPPLQLQGTLGWGRRHLPGLYRRPPALQSVHQVLRSEDQPQRRSLHPMPGSPCRASQTNLRWLPGDEEVARTINPLHGLPCRDARERMHGPRMQSKGICPRPVHQAPPTPSHRRRSG